MNVKLLSLIFLDIYNKKNQTRKNNYSTENKNNMNNTNNINNINNRNNIGFVNLKKSMRLDSSKNNKNNKMFNKSDSLIFKAKTNFDRKVSKEPSPYQINGSVTERPKKFKIKDLESKPISNRTYKRSDTSDKFKKNLKSNFIKEYRKFFDQKFSKGSNPGIMIKKVNMQASGPKSNQKNNSEMSTQMKSSFGSNFRRSSYKKSKYGHRRAQTYNIKNYGLNKN